MPPVFLSITMGMVTLLSLFAANQIFTGQPVSDVQIVAVLPNHVPQKWVPDVLPDGRFLLRCFHWILHLTFLRWIPTDESFPLLC